MSLQLAAQHLASQGRGPDKTLVHMSPNELRGLQALAVNHGGTLTINPETGLPEAGFLDKLLPSIIGFGLTAITGMPAWMAGLGVGAVETARTGNLSKGLMAGLGAYGGAGLGAGITGAGEGALGQAAVAEQAPSLYGNFGNSADVVSQNAISNATPFEKLQSGFGAVTSKGGMDTLANSMPSNTFSPKTMAMLAAAPLVAGDTVKSNMPQTVTKPGMIRRYTYDPYGGTYDSAGSYPAANGGLMGMADGGYNPGQLSFGMKEGGVAHYESGGGVENMGTAPWSSGRDIDEAPLGGYTPAAVTAAPTSQQIQDAIAASRLDGYSDADIMKGAKANFGTDISSYFTTPTATSGSGGLGSLVSTAAAPVAATSTAAAPVTTAAGSSDVNISDPNWVNATLQKINADAEARQAAKDKLAAQASTVTPFDKAAQDRLAAQFAPLNANAAQQQANTFDPNKTVNGLTLEQRFAPANALAAQQQADTFTKQQQADKRQQQADADAASAALAAKNAPVYEAQLAAAEKARLAAQSQAYQTASGTGGIGATGLDTNLTNYAKNISAATATDLNLATPTAVEARIRADMKANGVSDADFARATGKTIAELALQPFSGAAQTVFKDPNWSSTSGATGLEGLYSNITDYATNVNPTVANSLGLKTQSNIEDRIRADMSKFGVSDQDVFKATGKTVSQLAAQGVPLNIPQTFTTNTGVTGTGAVIGTDAAGKDINALTSKDINTAYWGTGATADGAPITGVHEWNPMGRVQRPIPRDLAQHAAWYDSTSGGTKQALNYLRGGAYSATPYTATGEIAKPYWESVGKAPVNLSTKKYLFQNGKYAANPDYVPITYSKTGERQEGMSTNVLKSQLAKPANSGLAGQALYDWAKANNVTPAQLAAATGRTEADIRDEWSGLGTKTAEAANGGIMRLAAGGMAFAGGGAIFIGRDGKERKTMDDGTTWKRNTPYSMWEIDPNYVAGGAYTAGGDSSGGRSGPPAPEGDPNSYSGGILGGIIGQDPSNVGVTDAVATAPDNSLGSGISPGDKAGSAPGLGDGPAAGEGNDSGASNARGGFINRGLFDQRYAAGGINRYNLGGYSDGGRLLRGPGDGVSDSIPATIGNRQPARLADGEFVVPARIVSELGNGSTEAGARKLYAMMDRVQRARRGTVGKGRVAKNSRAEQYLPA